MMDSAQTIPRSRMPLWPVLGFGVAIGAAIPLVVQFGFVIPLLLLAAVVAVVLLSMLGNRFDFFSPPVVFTLLWALCAAFGSMIVSIQQLPWNATVWACVIGTPLAFWAGDFLARVLRNAIAEPLPVYPMHVQPWHVRPVVMGGAVWLGAATVLSFYEFKTLIGAIPLFSENWETLRMMGGEGYVGRLIHAIAYSGLLLAIVMEVAILTQPRLFAPRVWALWALWFAAMGLAALWGSRHTMFYPLAAGVISLHLIRHRLDIARIAIVGAIAIGFVTLVGYIRSASAWGQMEGDLEWTQVLSDIGYAGWHPLLAQIHQVVGINFEIFRQLTETFPGVEPYHLGGFTLHFVYSLLPGTQLTLAEWQNIHWNTGFYGTLTSTFMGTPYADFGITGVFVWIGLWACMMRMLLISVHRQPCGSRVVWYSYLFATTLMLAYDNPAVKLSFILNLMILWMGMTAMGVRRWELGPLPSEQRIS